MIRVDLNQQFGSNARLKDRIFFVYSGTLSTADLTTILTTIRSAWAAQMASTMHTSHTLGAILGTDLTSAVAPQVLNSGSTAGTSLLNATKEGLSFVIKFKISRRYRGGHPRFYLGGMGDNASNTQNAWAPAFVASASAAFAAFIAACVLNPPAAVGTLAHVNVSYFTGFTVVAPPGRRAHNVPTLRGSPIVDTITAYSGNPLYASQRRRNQQSP